MFGMIHAFGNSIETKKKDIESGYDDYGDVSFDGYAIAQENPSHGVMTKKNIY